MAGKFCISSAFSLIYIYTAELFPTEGRNQAMGLCAMCARWAGVIAPYIVYLGKSLYAWREYVCHITYLIHTGYRHSFFILHAILNWAPYTTLQYTPSQACHSTYFRRNTIFRHTLLRDWGLCYCRVLYESFPTRNPGNYITRHVRGSCKFERVRNTENVQMKYMLLDRYYLLFRVPGDKIDPGPNFINE